LRGKASEPLWDGRIYCRECIEKGFEASLPDGLGGGLLRERLPLRVAILFGMYLSLSFLGAYLVVSSWFTVIAFLDGKRNPGADIFWLMGSFFVFPAILWSAGLTLGFAWGCRPAVIVYRGQVIVAGAWLAVCRLRDCKWKVGRLRDSFGPARSFPFLNNEAVLLILPSAATKRLREGEDRAVVALGLGERNSQWWQAFLTLADVPMEEEG
jgi:hypothetical protein